MMSAETFLLAVLALLLAPGPTNTLMGLAGARQGAAGVLRLIPAEIAGYLTTILPLTWIGAETVARWPTAGAALTLIAALWVLGLALRLWRSSGTETEAGAITARRIYLTTALNPKALVFGLVLLPPLGEAAFLPRLGLFVAAVAGVALLWGVAGAATQTGAKGPGRLRLLQRIAASWLLLVALSLAAKVVTA